MNLTTLRGDLSFWDRFAPWYEKWLSRGSYHQAIIKEISQTIEQGWRVLDIGAGTGVLSLPMAALGCTVEAVEPSGGMRRIFNEKLTSLGVKDVGICDETWETYKPRGSQPPDLIVACNSLHLTQGGLMKGMGKVFAQRGGTVCLVTEINQDMFIDFKEIHAIQHDYDFLFIRKVSVDSGFFFEDRDEVITLSKLLNKPIPVTYDDGVLVHRDHTDVAVVLWERR